MKKILFLLIFCVLAIGMNAQNLERDIKNIHKSVKEIDKIPKKDKAIATYTDYGSTRDSISFEEEVSYEFIRKSNKNKLMKINTKYVYDDVYNTTIKEKVYIKENRFIYFISNYYRDGKIINTFEVYMIVKSGATKLYILRNGMIIMTEYERILIMDSLESIFEQYKKNWRGDF